VGMSQWGAEGLARGGHSYRSILAHYYRNTTIGASRNPTIGVGVAWGLSSVRVRGAFSLVDATGKALVKEALGTWTFRWSGAGALAVEPPRGFGLPLEVGIVEAPRRVEVGEPTYLTIALSRPARVRAITDGGSGDPGAQVKEAGRRRVVWLAPLEPGRYEVRVHAAADGARRRSDPVEIEVAQPPPAGGAAPAEDRAPAGPGTLPWLALGLLAAIVAAAGVATSRMKT